MSEIQKFLIIHMMKNFSNFSKYKIINKQITTDIGNDEAIRDESEVQLDDESSLLLDEPIISNVKTLSYSNTLPLQFPDCTNIDYDRTREEFGSSLTLDNFSTVRDIVNFFRNIANFYI